MTNLELDAFLAQCCQQLERRQAYLVQEFGLGQCERFILDLERGLLSGCDRQQVRLQANITPIGSYCLRQRQWRWAWADQKVSPSLKAEAAYLKGLAHQTGLAFFQAESFESDEQLTWELTAMACHYLDAAGWYRMASDEGFWILALNSIEG